jgi:hypothetical protein
MLCRYSPQIFGVESTQCTNSDPVASPSIFQFTTCNYINGQTTTVKIIGINFQSPLVWISDQLVDPSPTPVNEVGEFQSLTVDLTEFYAKDVSIVIYNDCQDSAIKSCGLYSYSYRTLINFNSPTYTYDFADITMKPNFVSGSQNWIKVITL